MKYEHAENSQIKNCINRINVKITKQMNKYPKNNFY